MLISTKFDDFYHDNSTSLRFCLLFIIQLLWYRKNKMCGCLSQLRVQVLLQLQWFKSNICFQNHRTNKRTWGYVCWRQYLTKYRPKTFKGEHIQSVSRKQYAVVDYKTIAACKFICDLYNNNKTTSIIYEEYAFKYLSFRFGSDAFRIDGLAYFNHLKNWFIMIKRKTLLKITQN